MHSVLIDPVKVDAWKRVGAHANIVAPYHQHIVVAALGNSVSTPPQGITAEIAYYAQFDELKRDTRERTREKITFIDGTLEKSRDARRCGFTVAASINSAIEASSQRQTQIKTKTQKSKPKSRPAFYRLAATPF